PASALRAASSLLSPCHLLFGLCLVRYAGPRPLHSFPTRRSSDLRGQQYRHASAPTPCQVRGLLADALHHQPLPRYPTKYWSRLRDRKSTRLNSSHVSISYAVFCLKKNNMQACRLVRSPSRIASTA